MSAAIQKSTQDLKGCIQALKTEHEDGPITDNSTELHKFCAKLEYVLQIDMKSSARVGILGGKKDYWDYFCSCLGKIKGLNDGIRFVKGMKEVKTSLGRGRALIRYSLVHCRLGDTLQQCVSSEEITRQWYNEASILRQPQAFSVVANDLYDLNDLQFDLAPSGHELDTAWPTFARNAIGVGLYLWNPPTRSSSMASINSQPSQADSSRGLESMTEADSAMLDAQIERLQSELAECENFNRDLRRQLQAAQKELEDNKSLAVENEARMSSEMSELQRKNQELVYRSDKAVVDMEAAEKRKEKAIEELESLSAEYQRATNDLSERVETLKLQLSSEASMRQKHEEEMRTECLEYQRRIAELEVKLQGGEMELSHVREVESKLKSNLEAAEAKNKGLEERIEKLSVTMDNNLKVRSDQLSQEFQSVNLLRSLFIHLSSVQSDNRELNEMKKEFYTKIETLLGGDATKDLGVGSTDLSVNDLDGALSRLQEDITTSQKEVEEAKVEFETVQGLESSPKGQEGGNHPFVSEEQEKQIKLLQRELEDWKLKAEQTRNLVLDRELRLKEKTDQLNQVSADMKAVNSSVISILETSDLILQHLPELSSKSDLPRYYLLHDRKNSVPFLDVLKSLPDFLREIEGKLNALTVDSENVKRELMKEAGEKEDIHRKLESEIILKEQFSTKVKTFEEKMVELNNDLANKTTKLAELENEQKVMCEKFEQKEKENSELIQSSEKMEQELQEEMVRLKLKIAELQGELECVKEKCDGIESENNLLVGQIENLKEENVSVLKTRSEVEEKLYKVEQTLLEEYERARAVEQSLMQSDATRESERVSMEENHEKTITEVIQEHETKVEFMTEQFNLLKTELETVTFEKNDWVDKNKKLQKEFLEVKTKSDLVEKENEELKVKYETLTKEHQSLTENSEVLESQYESLKTEFEVFTDVARKDKETIDAKSETIKKLDLALDCARETSVAHQERMEEKDAELLQKQERIEELEEKLKASEEECKNAKMVMEREVSAIEFQRSSEAMQYQNKLENFESLSQEVVQWKERCADLEESIGDNTDELTKVKEEKERLKERYEEKIKEKETVCSKQNIEIQALETSLVKISEQLEEKTKLTIDLEETVNSLQQNEASQLDVLKEKLEQQVKDNEDLMKQIVKFGREKDVMWQRIQKVESNRRLKAMERWIDDKDVQQCMECEAPFSLTVRRHHCRSCGGVYCKKCTEFSILTSQSKKKVRVCEKCFVLHNHSLESVSQDTSAIIGDISEDSIEISFHHSRLSLSPDSLTPTTSTTDTEVELNDPDEEGHAEEDEDREAKQEPRDESKEEERLEEEERENAREEESVETKEETPSEESPKSDRDKDFEVITDQDVTEVRSEQVEIDGEGDIPKPEHTKFEAITSLDIQSSEGTLQDVTLTAGMIHMIPVIIDEEGILLCWEFTSSPKSIAFKVSYTEDLHSDISEEIVPLQRFNSHQQSASGELLTYKKGVYILQFDNTFSRLTSKTVTYQLSIKQPDVTY